MPPMLDVMTGTPAKNASCMVSGEFSGQFADYIHFHGDSHSMLLLRIPAFSLCVPLPGDFPGNLSSEAPGRSRLSKLRANTMHARPGGAP